MTAITLLSVSSSNFRHFISRSSENEETNNFIKKSDMYSNFEKNIICSTNQELREIIRKASLK